MSFVEILGHLSFAVCASAWLFRDILRIRIISVVASILSVSFNFTVWEKLPAGSSRDEMLVVITWVSVIALINSVMLIKTLYDRLDKNLHLSMLVLLVEAFPHMGSNDFLALQKIGRKTKHNKGDVLLSKGDATTAISIVIQGRVKEISPSSHRDCPLYYMWGDLTYIFGSEFSSSPVDIVCDADVQCLHFDYEKLRSFCDANPRAEAAILRSVVRPAGIKYGRIWTARSNAPQKT